jgi:hypothetical protein
VARCLRYSCDRHGGDAGFGDEAKRPLPYDDMAADRLAKDHQSPRVASDSYMRRGILADHGHYYSSAWVGTLGGISVLVTATVAILLVLGFSFSLSRRAY